MARIIEFLTVNVAVPDIDAALDTWRKLGLDGLTASHMPEPPAEITDVTLPIGHEGAISVIAPTGPGSPVQRFLDRRGAGAYSIAVRVDNLDEAMREWSEAGFEWVLPEPFEFAPGHPVTRYVPERLRVNWLKPKSLHGVLLECFEFIGDVKPHQ